MREPELLQIHDLIRRPGLTSFSLGMPCTSLIPVEALREAMVTGLGGEIFQYRRVFEPLQRHVVELMARRGVVCREEQIFVCNGSQQALHLLSRLLLDPGGSLLVEQTTYEGVLSATAAQGPEVLAVPTDLERGIDLDAVESLLLAGVSPAFLYVIPEGHNPLGVSLDMASRHRLIALARRFGVPIVEDDAYGLLSYGEEKALPALRAFDADWVFYVGSLSKVLAPALRVGWIVVPEDLGRKLSQLKHGLDLHVTTFAYQAAVRFFESGHFQGHLERIREEYRRRRDAMISSLTRYFPETARWSFPRSGFYVWVELEPGVDTVELLRCSVEEAGVAFCPGAIFAAQPELAVRSAMRLSYGATTPEQIGHGIRALGRLLRAAGSP